MRIACRVARAGATLLAVVSIGASVAAQTPPSADVTPGFHRLPQRLDVPFLPQPADLCGGAATAMLFRYWGERHASVRQFEPLVDHAAGGIADTVLIDAIRQRDWTAERLAGSEDTLRAEIQARRPPMLLIEDRPRRYHYVVAVGIDDEGTTLLHDPTWGPARKVSIAALIRAWRPTGFWMLRVTPGQRQVRPRSENTSAALEDAAGIRHSAEPGQSVHTDAVIPTVERGSPASTTSHAADASLHATTDSAASLSATPADGGGIPTASHLTSCDARMERALDEIDASGLEHADEILVPLTKACANRPDAWRELAGVRFAQQRWSEASNFANDALARDPHDQYAADVLGSSRFMLNDFDGALRAWNRNRAPKLDSVRITGLTRTRYALLVQALGFEEEQMLTADAFGLARRRLASLPDLSSTRLALRPDEAHFAVADIAVVERPTLPRGPMQWAATAAQAALEREASISLPGRTGQGDTWSGSVRWWEHRPRVALAFAAPLTSGPRGVWRVDMNWAAQEYGPPQVMQREEELGGSLSFSTWLAPNLRTELTAGTDRWTLDGEPRRKMVHAGVTVERRFLNDRLAAAASATRYIGANSFGLFDASLVARTSSEPRPLVMLIRSGVTHAGDSAPLALWNGAGDGRARTPLLRAHQLLDDGRIDGRVFGRTLAHATVEVQHWFDRPQLLRVGAAAFLDAAHARSRPGWSTGSGTQADVGLGLRIKVPGRSGAFRLDYAHGMVDGARALSIGWQPE